MSLTIISTHISPRSESTDQNVKILLERRFRDRLTSIKNLISSTAKVREAIKTDKKIRTLYTNRIIHQRHQTLNGETAPPLLLRQYNIQADTDYTDLLEATNNIQVEYNKSLITHCNFTEEEIKYIIEDHISFLSISDEKMTFPILCTIGDVTHTLKYMGHSFSDPRGFFFTRFIMEDTIVPIFDKIYPFTVSEQKTVTLKLE